MKPNDGGGGGLEVFYSFDTLYSSYVRFMVAWQPGGSGVYSLADLVDRGMYFTAGLYSNDHPSNNNTE